MNLFETYLQKLHRGVNPYAGFPAREWGGVWYGDPGARREILTRSLERARAGVVIEVGSFVGESAIFMAQQLKAQGRDAVIICVDTWYAGIDHYKGAPEKIKNHFGRPDFFYRFMANVIAHGCSNMILPLAMDSVNAARLLTHVGGQADMIYVDASHEQGDVLRDYHAYWPLVRPGGVFLVDDASDHFPGVLHDWAVFSDKMKIPSKDWDVQGEKIAVVKP